MEDIQAIDGLLDSLSVRLWSLVAVKVAARMAEESVAVQCALLDQAEQYRSLQTEVGQAIAERLDTLAARIARDWAAIEETLVFRSAPTNRDRRSGASSPATLGKEPAGAKRSLGRPRKTAETAAARTAADPVLFPREQTAEAINHEQ